MLQYVPSTRKPALPVLRSKGELDFRHRASRVNEETVHRPSRFFVSRVKPLVKPAIQIFKRETFPFEASFPTVVSNRPTPPLSHPPLERPWTLVFRTKYWAAYSSSLSIPNDPTP